jgi:uncharacterized protein YxeA
VILEKLIYTALQCKYTKASWMKKATICLLFLIFIITLSPFTLSNTNAQPSSIKVLDNYNWYFDQVGLIVVIAEVQNTGPNTISRVMVSATLTLSDGSTSDTYAMVWGYNLIPQQKAPLYLEFATSDSLGWGDRTVSKVDFKVTNADATSDYFYSDLTISGDKGVVAKDGAFWAEGNIQNTGNQDAKDIIILATYFTKDGQLAGVGMTEFLTPNPLTPSQTTSFKVGARDLNQTVVPEDLKIASYSLLIQTLGTILQGAPPTIVETPTPGPISTATQDPDSIQNVDSTITIIAVIIVIAIIVVVVLYLFKKAKPSADKTPAKSIQKTQPDKSTQKTKTKNNP